MSADAKFCPECGRKTEPAAKQIQQESQCDPLLCPHCHTVQDDKNWRFCMVCGEKREIPEPVPPTSEPVVTASEAAAVHPTGSTADEWFDKGKAFEFGHGQKQNYDEAIRCYEKAAKTGFVDAIFRLAVIHGRNGATKFSKEYALKGANHGHFMSIVLYSFFDYLADLNFHWDGQNGSLFLRDINIDSNEIIKKTPHFTIGNTNNSKICTFFKDTTYHKNSFILRSNMRIYIFKSDSFTILNTKNIDKFLCEHGFNNFHAKCALTNLVNLVKQYGGAKPRPA